MKVTRRKLLEGALTAGALVLAPVPKGNAKATRIVTTIPYRGGRLTWGSYMAGGTMDIISRFPTGAYVDTETVK